VPPPAADRAEMEPPVPERTRQEIDEPAPSRQPPVESSTIAPPTAPPPAPGVEQRPTQTFTVWSSTPGEGHHFGPKE
jgi:hypothetical protein